MKKVLFICNDTVGLKMAGPAIRCIELAKVLSGKFDISVAAKRNDDIYQAPVKLLDFDEDLFQSEINNVDVIVVQGDALRRFPQLLDTNAVLIADMYCPIPLEYHMSSHAIPEVPRLAHGWHVAQLMQEQLVVADYFLAASERQIDFWTGALAMTGRINALSMPNDQSSTVEHFLGCVPFGLSDQLPQKNGNPLRDKFNIGKDDFLMVWGGGIYEWFDPATIIYAIADLKKKGLNAHLVFLGVKHPNPGIGEHDKVAEAVDVARQLGILDELVHFNFGWVDYAIRHEYLMDADIGVSSHLDNIETRYSFRTRILDYLWCGLPIISTRGDEFGELVRSNGLGVSTGYKSVEDWSHGIERMMTDPNFYSACKTAIELEREKYKWSCVAKPLILACESIKPSADRFYIRAQVKRLKRESGKLSFLIRLRSAYARYGFLDFLKVAIRKILK